MEDPRKNMTVTRTSSAGYCTGTSADGKPEGVVGFPFARRHSSGAIRAFVWATASACSFRSSFGSESRGSRDSIRSIVVTPDSIPQFTIPKLALEDIYRSGTGEKEPGEGELDWQSTEDISEAHSSSASSSSSGISPAPRRKSISDHHGTLKKMSAQDCSFSCPLMEAEHCSDPASRAALSLPHLAKVTTPYGFVTLSQSPQMANEEALFFQTGHRRWGHEEETNLSRHPRLEMKRSVPVKTQHAPPHQSPVSQCSRSHSVMEIQAERQSAQSKAALCKRKKSLWGILRKHMRNPKESICISI